MALQVFCIICDKELEEPGAILLSPPDENDMCHKEHICKDCHKELSL